MSYELCKRINLDRKNNKIKVTCASNNLRPLIYSTYEVFEDVKDFDEKLINLFVCMENGGIQISTINDNTEDFAYAMWKVREYFRENNIDRYEELYIKSKNEYTDRLYNLVGIKRSNLEDKTDRDYEDWKTYKDWKEKQDKNYVLDLERKVNTEINYEIYGESFEIFKKALNEKIVGEYKVLLNNCSPIVKLGKYNRGYERFSYSYDKETIDALKVSYKKAYIITKELSSSRIELNMVKV